MQRCRLLVGVVALRVVAGCGGDANVVVADAGADAAITPPAPPQAAALPQLTPCPMGWREVPPAEADGVATCDPWPASGEATCADDEAHFTGEPGCARVGSACPAGEFPDALPGGQPILYVRAGGGAGGDGTQATPFGTIAEAMAAATSGTIVALGKGTFDEVVSLGGGVTLWGACVAMTQVASSIPSSTGGTLNTNGAGVVVRNLTVSGDRPGVWMAFPGASLHLEDVIVAGTTMIGCRVEGGAQLTGHSVVVRDTRSRPGDLNYGRGLSVASGAHADLGRAVLERNRDLGVEATGAGTTVTLADVAVRDTQALSNGGTFGRGIYAEYGARVDISRGAVERNREYGVVTLDGTTVVTLTDIVVRDTKSRAIDSVFGRGIDAELGSRIEVTRGLLERNVDVGVFAYQPGTVVLLTDLVVRDTRSRDNDHLIGRALGVQLGARMDVTRALLERNRNAGLFSSGVGTTVTVVDIVVRDTEGQEADGLYGWGLAGERGAHLDVTRALLERNRDVGVLANEAGAVVTVTDLVVRDTRSRASEPINGRALGAQFGAQLHVTRAVLERNRDVGVFADGAGTTITLEDLVVSDTESRELNAQGGRGVGAQVGAHVELTRAVLARNRDLGVFADGAGTTVTLLDVIVSDTRDQACEATGTCQWRITSGLGAYEGGSIVANRFALSGNALCGVQLATGGTMDLLDGDVTQNPIGANVQTPDFDLTRLQTNVTYRDNGVNFDGSGLPIPAPSAPPDPLP